MDSNGNGQILVYVNDNPNATSTFRSWLDGPAYSATPIPGDFDSDVDGADFFAWQTHFPTASSATLADGDADVDGDVDGADFVVWQTNFPFTPGPGVAPVREPHTLLLTSSAAVGLLAARRRHRS